MFVLLCYFFVYLTRFSSTEILPATSSHREDRLDWMSTRIYRARWTSHPALSILLRYVSMCLSTAPIVEIIKERSGRFFSFLLCSRLAFDYISFNFLQWLSFFPVTFSQGVVRSIDLPLSATVGICTPFSLSLDSVASQLLFQPSAICSN